MSRTIVQRVKPETARLVQQMQKEVEAEIKRMVAQQTKAYRETDEDGDYLVVTSGDESTKVPIVGSANNTNRRVA